LQVKSVFYHWYFKIKDNNKNYQKSISYGITTSCYI